MVKPGLLSVLSPIVVSLVFRYVGVLTGQDLLGPKVYFFETETKRLK